MSGWGRGYVTDVVYMPGHYRQQSPMHMAVACLLGGMTPAMPAPDAPYHYMELGCGRGLGAMVLAASNPGWRVTAIDFHPAHVAEARDWAGAAGLTNIVFLEADLSTLADDDLARSIPQADAVSLHGVWSWVPPLVRQGIVRLLAQKVAPGGMVHLSYNSLPAWQGALGMQRVLREVGVRLPARSDHQAASGFKFLQELSAAGAQHLSQQPLAGRLLTRIEQMPVNYLAHEYMNDHWQPCFHGDVVDALAGAKLDWVASAQLTENFPELMLNDAQRALYERFDDRRMRELVKDMCLDRPLRHDVFVRGARPLSFRERDMALMQLTLGLTMRPEDFEYEAQMPVGKATLEEPFYRPVVAALAERPRQVGELLELPGGGKRDNPAELVGMLVGLERAIPMLRPGLPPTAEATRLNQVIAERLSTRLENLGRMTALACGATGGGVTTGMIESVAAWRMQLGEGAERLDEWVIALAAALPPEAQQAVRAALQRAVAEQLPMLRKIGVLD